MTAEIIPLAFEDRLVRVVKPNGDPWFVGKDVCEVLEITKHHQALERLDSDERGTYDVGTPGGVQEVIIVSEAGVYRLIFSSRKPAAEKFKRWLAHDVLPALRKHGFYGGAPGIAPADFPSEGGPLEAYRLKLETVRMARAVHGVVAARQLWNTLGLPAVPGYEPVKDDEAWRLLEHLLGTVVMRDEGGEPARSLRECLEIACDRGSDELVLHLKEWGIAIVDDGETSGFVVANSHSQIRSWLHGTPWRDSYPYVLRRLPGAKPYRPVNYGGIAGIRRGSYLPAELLARREAPTSLVPLPH